MAICLVSAMLARRISNAGDPAVLLGDDGVDHAAEPLRAFVVGTGDVVGQSQLAQRDAAQVDQRQRHREAQAGNQRRARRPGPGRRCPGRSHRCGTDTLPTPRSWRPPRRKSSGKDRRRRACSRPAARSGRSHRPAPGTAMPDSMRRETAAAPAGTVRMLASSAWRSSTAPGRRAAMWGGGEGRSASERGHALRLLRRLARWTVVAQTR